ncbi:MAG: hypothetical protein IKP20_04605 [Candidatus Methanomethylophilaceae archaeon]|nr:hypothetical protein [Candidatus Methanomethylophilaceae archaeon]
MNMKDQKMVALLSAMGKDAMSADDIMDSMGLNSRSYFLKNYIRPALESGLVTMTGPDHPRSRNQKYRKTIV